MSVQSDDTCKVLYVIEKAQDPREILSRTCWNATENFPWGVGWPPFLPSPGEVTELPTPESEAPGADVSTSFMTKESQSFGVSPLSFSSNTCQKVKIQSVTRGLNKHRRPTERVGYFAQSSRLLFSA